MQFVRSPFYGQVCSKPMTRLATELGFLDVALRKVCNKHGIPNTPLGFPIWR